jgi:hypothetical protein
MIKTEVYWTLQLEGFHNWKNCPIDEVDFLQSPHRHMFHFKCWKDVTHDDRDIEFIMMKRRVQAYLLDKYGESIKVDPDTELLCGEFITLVFNSMSCEMIARDLINAFGLSKCEVSEDGENGAVLTYSIEPERT